LKLILALALPLILLCCGGCNSSEGYKHITPTEAEKMMASDDVLVVDVRTKEEYDRKRVSGAVLVPIDDIRAGKVDPLTDKDRTLLLYCWTGRRAEDSAAMLVKMGFKRVYDFGGLVEWTGPVEGDEVEPQYFPEDIK